MVDFLNPLADLAMGQTASYWISLGLNIIVSTIVGGLVLLILIGIASREWGEPVSLQNAFFVALLINIINLVGVAGFLSAIPFATLILPPLIWIILIKIFFSGLSFTHSVITGIIGWILSIFLIPALVSLVMSFIPL